MDSDGYINIRFRETGYIEANLNITFHNKDINTFKFIIKKLNLGKIIKINKNESRYIISNFL